jgi:hypothetical protein
MTLDQATALRLLREAIRQSGMSASRYARRVLIRNDRTVRRWLAGESPIPDAVRAFLVAGNTKQGDGNTNLPIPGGELATRIPPN